jgi:integrase
VIAIAAMALEYCILTAARSGEVYGAQWSEIDMVAKVWTLSAARMKGVREHRVPLCDRALAILERLSAPRTCDYVFSSPRGSKPLSHVAMAKVMSRLKVAGPTVHGFRSAFRDWAGNETPFPREVAEAALAHIIGDAAERAYGRGDALEKRRAMMEAWAQWCGPKAANVVAFARP